MINLLNLKKDNCYFFKFDEVGNIKPINTKFDENDNEIHFYYENQDGNYTIYHNDIHIDISGNIYFKLGNEKYIVDDGYRNLLVKAGYIYLNGYDQKQNEGDQDLNDDIMNKIIEARSFVIKVNKYFFDPNNLDDKFQYNGIEYSIGVSTVCDLVRTNEARKKASQPFYPYDKNIDRYGAVYISIYAKKITSNKGKIKTANIIIADILHKIGPEYSFKNLEIRKRIINNNINTI